MVLLFSSERIIRIGSEYYARVINFTDFLIQLSKASDNFHLAMLCDVRAHDQGDNSTLTRIDLKSDRLLELPNLTSRYQSFLYSFFIARKIRKYLREQGREGESTAVLAPGLNSISFVLSFLMPAKTRWYLFLRGDTRKTVDEIYRGSMLRLPMTLVIDLFQARVNYLVKNKRAHVFVFGQALQEKFYKDYPHRTHVVSPLIAESWLEGGVARSGGRTEADKFRVLYVGRLSAEKNIASLIEACSAARDSVHAFELTIVGDGPLGEGLTTLVSKLGLQETVSFTGRIANGPELKRLYDSHDVFCLPSKTEGTPRAIAESVARGLPVVAADVGSVRYMFSEGTIQLLQGFKPDDILTALAQVFDNLAEHLQIADRSAEQAGKHTLLYNVERIKHIIEQDTSGSEHD